MADIAADNDSASSIDETTDEPKLPLPRTHDASLTRYHMDDLATFVTQIELASANAFPNSNHKPYTGVYALLLFWENDTLGCTGEVTELHNLLEHQYNFDSEIWRIPTTDSYNQLEHKIIGFKAAHTLKTDLLIVYYAGHGYITEAGDAIWLQRSGLDSKKRPIGPFVEWCDLQRSLERAIPQVLFILDCCHAASATRGVEDGTSELLAACGLETWTPGVGPDSFTRALIQVLSIACGESFSAAQLHARMVRNLKKKNFRNIKTPIHVLLTDDSRHSVVIMPQSPKIDPLLTLNSASASSSEPAGSSHGDQIQQESQTPPSLSENDEKSIEPSEHSPQILLSLSLDEDQYLDRSSWTEWLKQVPALVNSLKIHAIYKSNSTLLILSIPMAVWSMLPPNRACTFVGIIKSMNKLPWSGSSGDVGLLHPIQNMQSEIAIHPKQGDPLLIHRESKVQQKSVVANDPRASRLSLPPDVRIPTWRTKSDDIVYWDYSSTPRLDAVVSPQAYKLHPGPLRQGNDVVFVETPDIAAPQKGIRSATSKLETSKSTTSSVRKGTLDYQDDRANISFDRNLGDSASWNGPPWIGPPPEDLSKFQKESPTRRRSRKMQNVGNRLITGAENLDPFWENLRNLEIRLQRSGLHDSDSEERRAFLPNDLSDLVSIMNTPRKTRASVPKSTKPTFIDITIRIETDVQPPLRPDPSIMSFANRGKIPIDFQSERYLTMDTMYNLLACSDFGALEFKLRSPGLKSS